MVGVDYSGIKKTGTISLAGMSYLNGLEYAGVEKGVDALKRAIRAYLKSPHDPNEPITIIAHSNGVAITLLALEDTNIKVNNLIFLSSPVRVDNEFNKNVIQSVLKKNLAPGGHVYNLFSTNDLIAHTVTGGARSWYLNGIKDQDFTTWIANFTKTQKGVPGINAHNALADPKMPIDGRLKDIRALFPMGIAPANDIPLGSITDIYAIMAGWK